MLPWVLHGAAAYVDHITHPLTESMEGAGRCRRINIFLTEHRETFLSIYQTGPKCHFGKQAVWIITIGGKSIYVQDWFDGFLAQYLLRWKERRRRERTSEVDKREGEVKMKNWK